MAFNTTSGAVFIPEIWSDETNAAYDAEAQAAKRVWRMSHNGKKGDTIHIPNVSLLTTTQFVEGTSVNDQSVTDTDNSLSLNQNPECSFSISKRLNLQESYSLRSKYTSQAAKALKIESERYILSGVGTFGANRARSRATLNTNMQQYDADGTAATAGGSAITIDGLLTALQYLDDNDVPQDDRSIFIQPRNKREAMLIDGFVNYDYQKGKPLVTGTFGDFQGVPIYVTTLLPTDANSKVNCIVMHKDSIVFATQASPEVEFEYSVAKKSTLVSYDMVYGALLLPHSSTANSTFYSIVGLVSAN